MKHSAAEAAEHLPPEQLVEDTLAKTSIMEIVEEIIVELKGAGHA